MKNFPLSILKTFKLLLICIVISITNLAHAECIVNSVSYDVGGRTGSGVTAIDRTNPITLSVLANRASSWDNSNDDVTTCDVSQFTSLYEAFKNNTTFNQDISTWDTSSVNNMEYVFSGATSLTALSFTDTSAVTNMREMFKGATSITRVTLPETGLVTNMDNMFFGTTSLTSVSLPKTADVTDMSICLMAPPALQA